MTPATRLLSALAAALAAAAPGPGAAEPLPVDLVITGGVTVDPERRVLGPGALAVAGDRIAAEAERYRAASASAAGPVGSR